MKLSPQVGPSLRTRIGNTFAQHLCTAPLRHYPHSESGPVAYQTGMRSDWTNAGGRIGARDRHTESSGDRRRFLAYRGVIAPCLTIVYELEVPDA